MSATIFDDLEIRRLEKHEPIGRESSGYKFCVRSKTPSTWELSNGTASDEFTIEFFCRIFAQGIIAQVIRITVPRGQYFGNYEIDLPLELRRAFVDLDSMEQEVKLFLEQRLVPGHEMELIGWQNWENHFKQLSIWDELKRTGFRLNNVF